MAYNHVNQVEIIGNIGRDPEIRSMQSGDKVASFSVATTESYTTKAGEKKESTEWHNVVVFGKLASIVESYFTKGDLVRVVGPLKTRKWQDNTGIDKYTTEIVVNGFGGQTISILKGGKTGGSTGQQQAPASDASYDDDLDDEVPF